ncbi:MAG TPA: hypothetical protein VJT15_04735 [Pyrinomonadaceae bacterium]|nr:hypothetical protein [Pyrinomonadaceae bacterium]
MERKKQRGSKKQRLVPKLLHAAQSKARYRDVHAFIGGTGAVGGTALLQMLSMYEEMMSISDQIPGSQLTPEDVPILIATGKAPKDIDDITKRLKRFVQSRHEGDKKPREIEPNLHLTHSGILVGFKEFELTVVDGLDKISATSDEDRPQFVRSFLDGLKRVGNDVESLMNAIQEARPMASSLRKYLAELPAGRKVDRYRSVIIGIPVPSLIAYHVDYLKDAAPYINGLTDEALKDLVSAFREMLRKDLDDIKQNLADIVLIAHTTAIGGMYDEEEQADGKVLRTYRLGFSHSARDDRLIVKQLEAEEFTNLFANIGVKVLITAAAIGIDEVRIRESVPLHPQIAARLKKAPPDLFSAPSAAEEIKIYVPKTFSFDEPPAEKLTFEEVETLLPGYSIRSGENGFFSVSNADALYRVMRVASASELGQVMSTVGLFDDDELSPWFPEEVCYYTEGDNSRQVFDLLNQPRLLQTQLSGLEPLALQELGSAKHQGELHTLSLLILLHRLRTLDIEAIDPYVNLDSFDPDTFITEHSRPLTFEDLANWEVDEIAHGMEILASAEVAEDLARLKSSRHSGLFEKKDEAVRLVLERALVAIQMIPSLGSPIIYERNGENGKKETMIKTGYFNAPLATLVTRADDVLNKLKTDYETHKNERFMKKESLCTFEEFRDFHICTGGFVDLRRKAILCTAKNSDMPLTGKIKDDLDEQALRKELSKLAPYSPFTTCGLTALLLRLRGLYNQLRKAMSELGTLHEFRWQMPRDATGHILVVPGAIEAFRMVSEGLEKTTGTERLDGIWGYEPRVTPERWNDLNGLGQ